MINVENEIEIASIIGQLYLRSFSLPQKEFDCVMSIARELDYRVWCVKGINDVLVSTPHHQIFYDTNELLNRNLRAAAKQEEV